MANYKETSMGAIFQNRVQEYGDKTLVKYKNKEGVWEEISWNRLNGMVRILGCSSSTRHPAWGQGGPVLTEPL